MFMAALFCVAAAGLVSSCSSVNHTAANQHDDEEGDMEFEVQKTEEEWREELTPEEYYVLREGGTERASSGEYYHHDAEGTYHCAGCANPLFSSEAKFHSGSGWPSFYTPIGEDAVRRRKDTSHGMVRTEVVCDRCGGHLGHVFDDGPPPTGLRYCINSIALDFKPKE
jgi:peptide-methionine (R)-S-oxide reductase